MNRTSATAVNRFGLGAAPGEINQVGSDPVGYFVEQLTAVPSLSGENFISTANAISDFRQFRQKRKENKLKQAEMEQSGSEENPSMDRIPNLGFEIYQAELRARLKVFSTTKKPFAERLCLFWANHFAISARSARLASLAGAYEREAIRPNILGNFKDLLVACSQHPAMLIYLDNINSFGPNSRAGRNREKGLNENLARELLELHTLGVDGGYTLNDIQELAKAITGWSVVRAKSTEPSSNGFLFNGRAHESGSRTVLGTVYKNTGSTEMGENILADMAKHPATAKHIARKLATYFVSDTPTPEMISVMENAFLKHDGELLPVYEAMLTHRDAFNEELGKFKSPIDLIASTARGFEVRRDFDPLENGLSVMGQKLWAPPSPKGWPDSRIHWATTDGIKTRLDFAVFFSNRNPIKFDVQERARELLGPNIRTETLTEIQRAEDLPQAVAILVMSPEFQHR